MRPINFILVNNAELPREPRSLRKMRPIIASLVKEGSKSHCSKAKAPPSPPLKQVVPGTILRLWLRSPWEDYAWARSISEGPSLVYRRGGYFQKATIQALPNSGAIELLQALSTINHPNIATFYDVYCYDDNIFTVSEYLELSLIDLDLQSFPLEEWEIATIIVEILEGSAYLLAKGVLCRDLSTSNIRFSTKGSIKIVPELQQYSRGGSTESIKFSNALLDLPYIAEIIEEMLLPRYHLGDDEAWSKDALDFFSCCLSGSIVALLNHTFLTQARSSSKLAPRIQFAVEIARIDALNSKGELCNNK